MLQRERGGDRQTETEKETERLRETHRDTQRDRERFISSPEACLLYATRPNVSFTPNGTDRGLAYRIIYWCIHQVCKGNE